MKQPKTSAIFFYLLLLLSFLGFMDLSYLTIYHFNNAIPSCSIITGCETVLASKYSTVGNLPISLPGALYYLVLIGLSSISIYTKSVKYKKFLIFSTGTGLLVSLVYLLIQIFVLKAVCQFCGFSDLMALGVFAVSLKLARTK